MKVFGIYVKEDCKNLADKYYFLNEGFSFYAIFFQVIWALYNRLWLLSLIFITINIVFVLLEEMNILTGLTILLVQLVYLAFIGFNANDWKAYKLMKNNYKLDDIIYANNLGQAQQIYFSKH